MVHRLNCSAACENLPGPGIEPVSPALACGFLTTAPPGKPSLILHPNLLEHQVLAALGFEANKK